MSDAGRSVSDGRRATLGALALIVVAALAGFGQLLVPGRVIASPHSDLYAYHFAAKAALRDALAHDASLTWREDQLSGEPGITHPQASWGNPLHALFWLMPPERAVGPTLFACALLTGLGAFALAAALGLGLPARLFAAVAGLFQAKLILATYAGWLGVVPAIALLPWLFAALVYARAHPGRRAMMALAVVGALLLHVGQMQLPYYAILVAVAWLVAHRGRDARTVVPAALVAVAAAAWLWVPLALEAALTTRAHADWRFFLGGHALGLRQLATFVRPEALGSPLDHSYVGTELWEDEAYFGILPLACAVVAVARAWRRPYVPLLCASFVATLVVAADTPLLHLVAALPGFRLFRCPSRLLFLTSLFGVALGAIGFEALLLGERRRRLVVAVALLAMAGEGTWLARRYLTTAPVDVALPASGVVARIGDEPGRFRVATVGLPPQTIWPVRPSSLRQVGGFDAYAFSHYRDYFTRLSGAPPTDGADPWFALARVARWELLDALAVRFVVTPATLTLPRDRFDELAIVDDEPWFTLYRGVARGRVRLWRNRHAGPFSEVWHPGWRATVDGTPVATTIVDGALLGAPPSATLRFVPRGWPAAPLVSLAAIVGLVGLALYEAVRRRRAR